MDASAGVRNYEVEEPAPGIAALTVRHKHDRFLLALRICADPERDVVLIDLDLQGDESLRPYALLTPRLGEDFEQNRGFVSAVGTRLALLAEQGPFGLVLMAVDTQGQDAWGPCNAGVVGDTDTWQDFARHGRMTWRSDNAGPGYVSLAGALPRRVTLALGFGTSAVAAATLAHSALMRPFADAWDRYRREWEAYIARVVPPETAKKELWPALARSAMVLRVSMDNTFPGAMVASLSTPWGQATGSRGGYHLVWSRDLVESAWALLALNLRDEALAVLRYLIATQQPDGHWYQNQWLGGRPYWTGIQLDEAAFPVLLAGLLADRDALERTPVKEMTEKALSFIAREGPVTGQDRWEEDGGVNAFTLAVAALVEGARFLDEPARVFALELADEWNACLDDWTFAEGGDLAAQYGVPGYYVRIAPPEILNNRSALNNRILIHNRADGAAPPTSEQIGLDFLQLVRYGLRRADDPKIRASVKIADALLRTETPRGPVWHRYTGDGYGEHPDGRPFDGAGQGRAWPLLTGERGHYALAAGEDPMPLLPAMANMAGKSVLLPEQVWDTDPIPEKDLFPSRPSGSAMPLVWAHAEFIKLAVSNDLGRPVGRPPQVWRRYQGRVPARRWVAWSFRFKRREMPRGLPLRLLLDAPATVHWGTNGWQGVRETPTRDSGLSVHWAELPTYQLQPGETIQFTFRWSAGEAWEGQDYEVRVAG